MSMNLNFRNILGNLYNTNEQKELLKECAKLQNENPRFTDTDCAAKFGVHPTTISNWRKRHGIL